MWQWKMDIRFYNAKFAKTVIQDELYFQIERGGEERMETSVNQMMDEKTEELLEQVREELHIMVDQKIDDFRRCLVSGES